MPKPCWYHITDVGALRSLLDQRDYWWREASDACNRVAADRDRYQAALASREGLILAMHRGAMLSAEQLELQERIIGELQHPSKTQE
jgi:hypothetical protein